MVQPPRANINSWSIYGNIGYYTIDLGPNSRLNAYSRLSIRPKVLRDGNYCRTVL